MKDISDIKRDLSSTIKKRMWTLNDEIKYAETKLRRIGLTDREIDIFLLAQLTYCEQKYNIKIIRK